jgi:hypothetical protein
MENEDSKGKTLKPALSGEWGVNTASGSSWTYDRKKISCRNFVNIFAKIRFLFVSEMLQGICKTWPNLRHKIFSPLNLKIFPFCQKKGKTTCPKQI